MNKFSLILLAILLAYKADARIYEVGNLHADTTVTTNMEYDSSDDSVSVYNTGLELTLKHQDHPQASVYFRGNVNGKISELNGDDFNMDAFVKELKANYEFDRENAVLIFSVGKMATGTKTNQGNPTRIGGVMGFRLSIKPKKIPLIQQWMKKNGLKITRIDITRYDASSKDELDFANIGETDMTAYALYLSKGRNLHTFFILKEPDSDSHAPRGISIGGAYMFDLPRNPSLFALYHNSESEHVDLDIYVLSASFEIVKEVSFNVTWSKAVEHKYGYEETFFDYSLSKRLYQSGTRRNPKTTVDGRIGIKSDKANIFEGNNDFYFGIKIVQ